MKNTTFEWRSAEGQINHYTDDARSKEDLSDVYVVIDETSCKKGHEYITLVVGNQRTLTISMRPSITGLNEVVIVGYGQVKLWSSSNKSSIGSRKKQFYFSNGSSDPRTIKKNASVTNRKVAWRI